MPTQYKFSVDGREFQMSDPIVTGREIRSTAGLAPASDFVLIAIGERTSRSVGLEEGVTLEPGQSAIFLSFQTDRIFSFTVNERGYEWGAPLIAATAIRLYAQIPEDQALFLDSDADKPISNDGVVDLARKGTERIISKTREKIRIIVNTRERFVEPGLISFQQIVQLAFPDMPVGPNTSFTVSYRKGPDEKPEGTLVEGESIKVRKGMSFNVSATDKS